MSNKTIAERCAIRKGQFRPAQVTTQQDGSMDLVLPDIPEEELQEMLPKVSMVTVTRNHGAFIGAMLYNWMNIRYPREKLEWIIVDDTAPGAQYDLGSYIQQDDPNITYIRLKKQCGVAEKRNKAVNAASGEYIVHMNPTDYYFPDHVLAKIRLIYHYRCPGILSSPVGVYNLHERSSNFFNPNTVTTNTNNVPEGTMAYRKEYWDQHKFYSDLPNGDSEGRAFVGNKFSKWLNVHFMFNCVAIDYPTHDDHQRFAEKLVPVTDLQFENIFPPGFNTNLDNIRDLLRNALL